VRGLAPPQDAPLDATVLDVLYSGVDVGVPLAFHCVSYEDTLLATFWTLDSHSYVLDKTLK